MVNFDCSLDDGVLIAGIARRYAGLLNLSQKERVAAEMAVTAVHCNGQPLRLKEMLDGPIFHLAHDVGQILADINTRTGRVYSFVPRYAVKQ